RFSSRILHLSDNRTICPNTGQQFTLWIRTSFDTGSSWRTMLPHPRAVAARSASARLPLARVRACAGQHRGSVRPLRGSAVPRGTTRHAREAAGEHDAKPYRQTTLSVEAKNRSRATGWAPGHRCSRWIWYPPSPVATPDVAGLASLTGFAYMP